MPTRKKPAATAALRKASSLNPMGPLELAAYIGHVEEVASRRELEAAAQAAQDEIMKSAGMKRARTAGAEVGKNSGRDLGASRKPILDNDEEALEREVEASTPGRVAARLLEAIQAAMRASTLDGEDSSGDDA